MNSTVKGQVLYCHSLDSDIKKVGESAGMSGLDVLDAEDERLLAQLIQEAFLKHVILVQRNVRRFIQRCRIHEYIAAKYEKIYDPKRHIYYYYNIQSDKSSWKKPRLLLYSDIFVISPTYTLDEAATMIQRQARRKQALKAVRILYKSVVSEAIDASSGKPYYYSKKSGETFWKLPAFMNGIYDHNYKEGEKDIVLVVEEEEEEESVHGDSSEESEGSEDSEEARMKRVLARKYPRYPCRYDSVNTSLYSIMQSATIEDSAIIT